MKSRDRRSYPSSRTDRCPGLRYVSCRSPVFQSAFLGHRPTGTRHSFARIGSQGTGGRLSLGNRPASKQHCTKHQEFPPSRSPHFCEDRPEMLASRGTASDGNYDLGLMGIRGMGSQRLLIFRPHPRGNGFLIASLNPNPTGFPPKVFHRCCTGFPADGDEALMLLSPGDSVYGPFACSTAGETGA